MQAGTTSLGVSLDTHQCTLVLWGEEQHLKMDWKAGETQMKTSRMGMGPAQNGQGGHPEVAVRGISEGEATSSTAR